MFPRYWSAQYCLLHAAYMVLKGLHSFMKVNQWSLAMMAAQIMGGWFFSVYPFVAISLTFFVFVT